MSLELARRFMWYGVVADGDFDAAIQALANRGVPFARALFERGNAAAMLLDRELEKSDARLVAGPIPDPDLYSALPNGMCEALLALPLRRDARGVVEVAAADPSDPHVAVEFSFQLDAPVRVIRAKLRDVLRALERAAPRPAAASVRPPPDSGRGDRHTPAFGSLVARPPMSVPTLRPPGEEFARHPSEAPIPLVKKPAGSLPSLRLGQPLDDEPVISLTRSKVPVDVVQSSRPADLSPDDSVLDDVLGRLERVADPDAVVEALMDGISSAAPNVAVFSVKSGSFQGRAGRGVSDLVRLRALSIPSSKPSVLETAIETGYYLGPLPPNETHASLGSLLGERQEVCVSVVSVSGKPALLLVAAGFRSAFVATRRAEKLVRAAGEALARILRSRRG